MDKINSTEFKEITKETLKDSVADTLRNAILRRTLEPGQRMPESQIASKLGVSRAPVRDALAVLLQEGLVERDDRGVVVAELTAADIVEINSLRLALETQAVRLAITNATENDFAQMNENIRRAAETVASGEAGELDLEFHELLVRSAKHQRLLICWLTLKSQIRWLLVRMDLDDVDYPEHSSVAHREFLELLRTGDETKAVEMLESHLHNTHRMVSERYGESLRSVEDELPV